MIVVDKVLGLATVQDAGRFGLASQGVPPSGFMVPELAHIANAAVGNEATTACVEIFGRFKAFARGHVLVANERGERSTFREGDDLVVDPDPTLRVRYLAIAGGIDGHIFLGSRSALPACGLGIRLRNRIQLRSAGLPTSPRPLPPPLGRGPIRVVLGPDPGGEALLGKRFRISTASDRTGTRLETDDRLPSSSGTMPSSPTVIGAIQLPHGGSPIVIGPDGPVTGGYPIVAVITRADLGRFHALPLGVEVIFS
jgi:allophanate hydrolase subunit 2